MLLIFEQVHKLSIKHNYFNKVINPRKTKKYTAHHRTPNGTDVCICHIHVEYLPKGPVA